MKVRCAWCKCWTPDLRRGSVNRSRKLGWPIYCDRTCAGRARRKPKKKKAQRVEEKRLYDMQYRKKHRAMLKRKKAERHLRTYDPVKEARKRKKRMKHHVEYCRQPQYRRYKKKYDENYRAKKLYGEFWESSIILNRLDKEVDSRMSDYEVRKANGTLNKQLQRRRDYAKKTGHQYPYRYRLKGCLMGYTEPSQKGQYASGAR